MDGYQTILLWPVTVVWAVHSQPCHALPHGRFPNYLSWWDSWHHSLTSYWSLQQCCYWAPTATAKWGKYDSSYCKYWWWSLCSCSCKRFLEYITGCILWCKGVLPKRILQLFNRLLFCLQETWTSQERGIWTMNQISWTWRVYPTSSFYNWWHGKRSNNLLQASCRHDCSEETALLPNSDGMAKMPAFICLTQIIHLVHSRPQIFFLSLCLWVRHHPDNIWGTNPFWLISSIFQSFYLTLIFVNHQYILYNVVAWHAMNLLLFYVYNNVELSRGIKFYCQ